MEKDDKKNLSWNLKRLLMIFFIWNVILTLSVVGILLYPQIHHTDSITFAMEERTKYILYIGTNDKDIYKQEISTEEAD